MQNPYSPVVRGLYSFEGPATYQEILTYVIHRTGGRSRELHNIIMSSLEHFIQLGKIRKVFNEHTYMLMPDFLSFLESFYYMEQVNRPQVQEEENNVHQNEVESVEQRVGLFQRLQNVRVPINVSSANGGLVIRDSTTRRSRVVTRSESNRNRAILNSEPTVQNHTVRNMRVITQNSTVERQRSRARNLLNERPCLNVGNRTAVRSNLTAIIQRDLLNESTARNRRCVKRKTANRAGRVNCRASPQNLSILRNLVNENSSVLISIRETVRSAPQNRVLLSQRSTALRNRSNSRNIETIAENHAINTRNQTTTRIRPITRSCELSTGTREIVRSGSINSNVNNCANQRTIEHATVSRNVNIRHRQNITNLPVSRPRTTTSNNNVVRCGNTFRTGRIVKRAIHTINSAIARKHKVTKQKASNRVNRALAITQNAGSTTQNVESITQNFERPTTSTLRTRSNKSTNRHHPVTKRGVTTANSKVVKHGRVSKKGRIVKRRSAKRNGAAAVGFRSK